MAFSTRYSPLSASLYKSHREKLRACLPDGALVVVHNNDAMPTNADGGMPFVVNSNFFYLCGIEQEESCLLLSYDAAETQSQEILFLRKKNQKMALWEGEGLSPAEATAISAISTIAWLEDFEAIFHTLIVQASEVFIESNEHYRAKIVVESRNARFIKRCKAQYPLHKYARLAPLMSRIRARKDEEEKNQIARACHITHQGFLEAAKAVKKAKKEYELEAACLYSFMKQGAKGFAYPPIIASGKNACILHYTANNAPLLPNELVLMDIGASYGNYNADITRVIPVSGRFTKRQKELYEAVLRIQRYAMNLLKPGVILHEYQKKVEAFMEEELCSLGLLTLKEIKEKGPEALKQYFMHGISHHLGIDVHDAVHMHEPLAVGAVLTVEPGIYIPQEGIGIRLENDVVITPYGMEDLTKEVPIEIPDIEKMMEKT